MTNVILKRYHPEKVAGTILHGIPESAE